jgi:hypothetical protein
MEFAAYDKLDGRPSIVVDGYGARGTVLCLSHWPGAGTPDALKGDLSTNCAFNYLDAPGAHVDADFVSNNHFDEDGLCGIFAVLHPEEALARRARVIDVASAGDFGVFADRDSARIAFALMAFADEARSPLDVFGGDYQAQSAALYAELLPRLPEMLDHPERFAELWRDEDARLTDSERRIEAGEIAIEERGDLAVVTMPDGVACHPSAIHNRTRCMKIAQIAGRRYEVRYRYETWVDYRSERLPARIDLAPLAAELNETDPGWTFDGNDDLQPALHRDGESALSPEDFRARIEAALA